MASLLSPTLPVSPLDPIWRISVEQYHAMIDAGILPSGSPVELVEGVLLEKMSKKPRHRAATHAARKALESLTPSGWFVDSQEPITLADSEPEPDVVVARGRSLDYVDRHPSAADVALVVEVADASATRDRGVKSRVYARAGIAEYWLVDLNSERLEVRTEPVGGTYRGVTVLSPGDRVSVRIEGVEAGTIEVATLFPGK